MVANVSEHNASVTALAYDGTRQLLFSASDEAETGECCGAVLVWNTVASPPVHGAPHAEEQALRWL